MKERKKKYTVKIRKETKKMNENIEKLKTKKKTVEKQRKPKREKMIKIRKKQASEHERTCRSIKQ